MQETTISFFNDIPINATVHRAQTGRKNISIIYLHGGGLIYGNRDDLPKEYVQLFLEAGFDLIMLDYLLAPESTVDEIVTNLEIAVSHFTNHIFKEIGLQTPKYVLFGRSAGSYLALLAIKRNKIIPPSALIIFYGYYSLNSGCFLKPTLHYLRAPQVPQSLISAIIGKKPLTNGPIHKRYAIYLYARQTGNWLSLITGDVQSISKYCLTHNDLKNLPPTFLAASDTDYDVPFDMSKTMAEMIPSSHLYIVQNRDHDFDRDPKDKQAKAVYISLLSWLKENIPSV